MGRVGETGDNATLAFRFSFLQNNDSTAIAVMRSSPDLIEVSLPRRETLTRE